MSEKRFSLWHIVGLLAIVLALGGATVVGGAFVGYKLGQARAQATLQRFNNDNQGGFGQQMPFGGQGGNGQFGNGQGGNNQPAVSGPYLGVTFESITADLAQSENLPVQTGALIRSVEADSPAATAGLQTGDIIQSVDRHPVDEQNTLRTWVTARSAGDTVSLTVLRAGQTLELSATLAERTGSSLPFEPGQQLPPGHPPIQPDGPQF